MGIRRPIPKAFVVTLSPGGACRLLYSFRFDLCQNIADDSGGKAVGDDFVRGHGALDVALQNAVEYVVRRQAVLVLLVRPEFGRGRLLDARARNDLAAMIDVLGEAIHQGLRQIGEHRKPARHVAVQRAVAHGELRFIARCEQQAPEFVAHRHEEIAADPRLYVFLGDILGKTSENAGEHFPVCPVKPVDAQRLHAKAEVPRERDGVVDASLR